MPIRIYIFTSLILFVLMSCTSKKHVTSNNSTPIEDQRSSQLPTLSSFGVVGDGVADDSDALQRAIDSGMNPLVLKHAKYKITQPLSIPHRYMIQGNKASIYYYGNETALQAKKGIIAGDCDVSNLYIEVNGDGAKGISISNFQYSNFYGLGIRMKGKNCVGIYMIGDGKGAGPYYNSINNVYIIGDNDNKKSPGQIGILLDDFNNGILTASGPNANNISNIKRIAGVSIAIDIIAGTGNMFSDIQTESIFDYHYRLNYRKPDLTGNINKVKSRNTINISKRRTTKRINGDMVVKLANGNVEANRIVSYTDDQVVLENSVNSNLKTRDKIEIYETKAAGNKFNNLRSEGHASSVAILLCYGSMNNSFKEFDFSSIGPVKFIRQTNSLSNSIGDLMPVVFSAKNVKANSTTQLTSNNGPFGGMPISLHSRLDGIHIKASAKTSGVCRVKAMRNSAEIDISPRLNYSNLYSNYEIIKNTDSRSNARLRPGDGLQLELITDKDWTPNDITVTVWLAK